MQSRSINFFLLCLSAVINVGNGGDPVIITPERATDITVQSLLDSIDSKNALPVILFKTEESEILLPLDGLKEAEIVDGRLASRTTFHSKLGGTQIFFCPESQAQTSKQCLAPKKFKESEPLECDDEPIPILLDTNQTCGPSGTSIRLDFSYEICPAEGSYQYNNDPYNIYELCYNKRSKKMLSASYNLIGTTLFKEKLLIRERDVEFAMNEETYGHIDSRYLTKLHAEIRRKPQYMLQNFVPIEDMALVTSRKTTHYFANFVLQHNLLFDVWNEIGSSFRDYAIEKNHITFRRLIGVFDVPKKEIKCPRNENQKIDIWITILTYHSETNKKGLAVLMNNFIMRNSNCPNAGQYIDSLCGPNYCGVSLKTEFNAIGVEGRCCEVTKRIFDLFTPNDNFIETTILRIEGITD